MGKLLVTLKRSPSKSTKKQLANLQALGLKRINDQVVHEDNAAIRGMIFKVSHLVTAEEIAEEANDEN